jgi:hypothetical protein
VVDTIEEAVKAVPDVASLRRHACRQVFEQRFDSRRMARDYVKLYSRLMGELKQTTQKSHRIGSPSVAWEIVAQ